MSFLKGTLGLIFGGERPFFYSLSLALLFASPAADSQLFRSRISLTDNNSRFSYAFDSSVPCAVVVDAVRSRSNPTPILNFPLASLQSSARFRVGARRLATIRAGKRRNFTLTFRTVANCGGTVQTRFNSLTVTASSRRGPRNGSAWLKNLSDVSVLSPAVAKLNDSFPNLSFDSPVDLQTAKDGSSRLFVVEQPGIIRWFTNNAASTDKPAFLDIRDRVNNSGSEQGLLGLAFDPNFSTNRRFYVNYTRKPDGATVIARFEANTANPQVGLPSSEEILLTIPQPFANHNGGGLAFGADGFLHIALGDGGAGGDPLGNGQKPGTFLGKILRIDVSGVSGYTVPATNPFFGGANGFKPEIFAYGLRNPWRITFDSQTGELWTGDVGQGKFEEIDIVRSGGNYGWNITEGNACYSSPICNRSGLIAPIHTYGRDEGQSVTGGYVYRGTAISDLVGKYIFADFQSGRIWTLERAGSAVKVKLLLKSNKLISSFGVDEAGELYLLSYQEGKVLKFVK